MEETIKKFTLKGNVYTWEFKESNPNRRHLNFTADQEGCESLIQLLELMQGSNYSSKKTIALDVPEKAQLSVPNDRNEKWRTKSFLLLCFNSNESSLWTIKDGEDVYEINFGREKINEFIGAVKKVKEGNGDFAIGDKKDENILYFWWVLGRSACASNSGYTKAGR